MAGKSKSSSGGNKKRASRSDEAYFARYIAGGMQTTHQQRRVARHVKRMLKKAIHRERWQRRHTRIM